ncbi:hypothetical protein F5144DRAFT_602290 [Chaetomium tenue]|uniref:Uncharacterized protein n=1 Tax=Chaetomium tenue TaxID=1854479 RepID=A0ACB7P5B7_9PEZI|nr:hypothetical protein F5144DRAFT_602290 [Chaetomium globosum]
MVGLRRRKRQLQIPEPFDFKREATLIPGISENEYALPIPLYRHPPKTNTHLPPPSRISVLREKAAASRLGIAHADTYSDTILPLPHHHHRLRPRGSGGPLSLSPSGTTAVAATPPPRLSISIPIPIPIPIPGGGNPASSSSRHGSGSSSLRSSSTVQGYPYHGQSGGGLLGVSAGGVERVSSSMNDLDLLLFGNPSGVEHHHHVAVAGRELVMPPLGPVVSAGSAMTVSPLELDGGELGGGGGGVDWGMEFEFQMGSPVSPLSPASRKRAL